MVENKQVEVDVDKIIRTKAGKKAKFVPRFVVNWLKRIIHQDEMNIFYREHQDEEGVEWLKSVLEYFDMKLVIKGQENLPAPGQGRYTFVSNHPLGGIDGVTIGAVLGEHYDGNIRYLLNDLLMNLPGLRPLGVPINKTGAQGRETPRLVEEAFQSDHQIIMFPAGLCSRKQKGVIRDLEWKKTFVQKSIQYERNVVPIYFEGRNSNRFYNIANVCKTLGIKFNVAMAYLVDEMFRHQGDTFRVVIGQPIPWQTFDRSRTHTEWAQWLRQQVYEL